MRLSSILCACLVGAACAGAPDLPPVTWNPAPVPQPVAVSWADGLSLDEALTLALRNNAALQAVRTQQDRASAQRAIAQQWTYNPEIEGEASRAGSEEQRYKVGLSQTFEIAGQRGLRIRAAEESERQTRASIAAAERELRSRVMVGFAQALFDQQQLAIARNNLDLATKLLEAAQARFQARQIPQVEVNLVKLQQQRTLTETLARETAARTSKAQLARLIGEPERTDFQLTGELAAPAVAVDRAKARAFALERRPDLAALKFAERAAEFSVRLASAQAWPDPKIGVFYEREKQEIDPLSDKDNVVGLEIGFPLPVFNQRRGEIMAAEAERKAAQAELRALTHKVTTDVDVAIERLDLGRRVMETYEKDLNRLSQKNLEDFERAYRAGEVGTLEVLRAQEDANRTAQGYLQALLAYRTALAELEHVIAGDLSEVKK